MCFCVYFYCELWNPCFQRIWSRICSSSTSYFLSTWGASWFVAMNNHRIFLLPVFVFLRCVDGLRKWYFNYVAYVGLCSLFVPSLVWVLISTSVGISYCLLELFLCGSECVSHEPNLKGKCKMKCIHKDWIHYIQLPAKLLDYFLRNNKSNINQSMDALSNLCAMLLMVALKLGGMDCIFSCFCWVGIGVSTRSWRLVQWKRTWGSYQDMERVFWTVLFWIASLVFLFFTPSVSSLVGNWSVCREPRTPVVKLICVAFQPLFSRLLRCLMEPKCVLYLLSFSCSFFVAQSSLVSIALVYSRNIHDFCSFSKASPSGLREIKVSWSPSSKSTL